MAGHLDRHHTDPLDRALVAQALAKNGRFVTADHRIAASGVDVITT
jgi:PIN domain nuclease of toxin-antitoxin system